MTIAAGDAHPWPIYNARLRIILPILDADGDLVTGATGLDSEASQDTGTFADCTNEATEIATSSGVYYLDLIATELDTKSTAIIVKTSSSGAKTTTLVLYPRRFPVLRTGTAQAGAASTITLDSGASALNNFYNGCYVNITNNSPANALGQARRITGYVGSTKVATVEAAWGTNPSSASTFEILFPGDAAQVNGFFGTEVEPSIAGVPEVDITHIAGAAVSTTTAQLGVNVVQLSTDATAADNAESFFDGVGYAGTNNVIPSVTTVTGNVNGSVGSVTGAVGSVTGAVGSVTGLTASDVGAIKTKTDFLPSATAGAAGGVFIAGANAATSVTTALTANITGNLSGSVGSVTGAVGSVTGAVGSLTTNNDKAGYSIAVGGVISGAHAAAELNTIADAVQDRNMATGTDSGTDSTAVRTPRQAWRALRNKATVAGGVLTVKKEDDVTTSFTAAVATAAGNPISEIDPT